MFKKLMYEALITRLNDNTKSTKFQGGYLIGLYGNGIPYVIQADSLSKFNYERSRTIPVSEEYFQETPSVNASDRSDYVAQYQIMFQTSREDEVLTVLDEFREYYFANKTFTLDGYNVAIKTTRGDKQPAVPVDSGDFYVRYKISVYLTAVKSGYIIKDADKWEMKLKGGATWYDLKVIEESVGTTGATIFKTASAVAVGLLTNTTLNGAMQIVNNNTFIEVKIYEAIMNKLTMNQIFDLRHTFNDVVYTYRAIISGGARTQKPNGVSILSFNWIEVDE